jgi:hypothetical protein
MPRSLLTLTLTGLVFLFLIGCSHGSNPAAPSDDPASVNPGNTMTENISQSNHTSLMGYFDIYFDFETREFEAIRNRHAEFTLNIVPFLNEMTNPLFGLTFENISFFDSIPGKLGVNVAFQIHHPLPGHEQYNIYDFLGVVIGDGIRTLSNQGFKVAQQGTDLFMKNPDGYTRWFNPTEFTTELIFGYAPGGHQNHAGSATLNPYKYYANQLTGRHAFDFLASGDNNDGLFSGMYLRMMKLEFILPPEGIGVSFGYAMVVAWEEQGSGPYSPVHHSEALACKADIADTIWFDSGESGGDLEIDFSLFAWEHQPEIIRIESTVLDSVATFDAASIATPVDEFVTSYHIQIPVRTDLPTYKGHDVWIFAEYPGFDYSNGMPEIPHAEGDLTAVFWFPVIIEVDDPEIDIYVTNHEDFQLVPKTWGTPMYPFKSLAIAMGYASPGDVIGVDMGSYAYSAADFRYSTFDYLTIKADNWYSGSGRPAIGGQFSNLDFSFSSNVTIEGFEVVCDGPWIVYGGLVDMYGSNNITIRDCFITSTYPVRYSSAAVSLMECDNITITNCLIKGFHLVGEQGPDLTVFSGIEIRGHNNGTYFITKNEFTGCSTEPDDSAYIYGIQAEGLSDDSIITNNLIHHLGDDPGDPNKFKIYGIRVVESAPGTTVANNTIDNLDTVQYQDYHTIDIRGMTIDTLSAYSGYHSNIVTNIFGLFNQDIIGINSDVATDYSCVYNLPPNSWRYYPTPEGPNSINADPLYINNTTYPYDYQLGPGSPCIGTGMGGNDMGCYGNLAPGEVVGLLTPE